MPRKIHSGSSQFVPSSATKTLHTGPGKIYQIITGNLAAGPNVVALYDGLTGPPAPILIVIAARPGTEALSFSIPLIFTTGLTVVTQAENRAFVLTEAEA